MLSTPRFLLRTLKQPRYPQSAFAKPAFIKAFATMATDPAKYKLNHSMYGL